MAILYAICIGFLGVVSIIGASGREKDMFDYFDKNGDGQHNRAESNNYTEYNDWKLRNGGKNMFHYFDKNNDGSLDRNEAQQYSEFTVWKGMNTNANDAQSVEQERVPEVQSKISGIEEDIYFEGSGETNNNEVTNPPTNPLTHHHPVHASINQKVHMIPVLEVAIAAEKNLFHSITTIQQILFGRNFKNIETEIGSLNGHIGGLEQGVKTEVKTALVGLSQAQVYMNKMKRILLASAKDVIDRVDRLKINAELLDDDDIYEDVYSVKTVVSVYIGDLIALEKRVLQQIKEGHSAYQHAINLLSESNSYLKRFARQMTNVYRKYGHDSYIDYLIRKVRGGCNDGIAGGRIGLAICYGIRGKNLRYQIPKFEGKVNELVNSCGKAAKKTSNFLETSNNLIEEISDEQELMQTSISDVASALKAEERNNSIASAMENNIILFKREGKNSKIEIFNDLNALKIGMQAFINSNKPIASNSVYNQNYDMLE